MLAWYIPDVCTRYQVSAGLGQEDEYPRIGET